MLKQIGLLLACFALSFSLQGQPAKKVFSLEKGQVLDIILLSQKADSDSLLKVYFATAFPIAEEMGYQRMGGMGIVDDPMQGNYHPSVMALGSWKDKASRAAALQKLEAGVDGFHEMRRAIWSNFDLTYWEMPEAVTFAVDRQRYNVVTAYWKNETTGFDHFLEKWEQQASEAQGELIIALQNGESPFGYYFKPDYLSITSWKDEEEFRKFYAINNSMDQHSVAHVNQFRIQ